MNYCEKCGAGLSNERFCPNCGTEIKTKADESNEIFTVSETEEASETSVRTVASEAGESFYNGVSEQNKPNVIINKKQSSKRLILLVLPIMAIICVIAYFLFGTGPNFKSIYKKYCDPIWSDVANDGSYLSIDTNPYDIEDDNDYEAFLAIKAVNKKLGLPESILESMMKTTGADGKQTEEYGRISISWKYHPDKGLEVTYKKR